MEMIILALIFCFIGAGVTFIFFLPKIKQTEQDTKHQEEKIIQLDLESQSLEEKITWLKTQYNEKLEEYQRVKIDTENEIKYSKENIAKQYRQEYQKYQEALDECRSKFAQGQEDLQQAYLDLGKELVNTFSLTRQKQVQQMEVMKQENVEAIQKQQEYLDELRAKTAAAIEANKRAEEQKNNENFYKLVLTKEDLEEIAELRKILNHFRNPEPVNKVIWKSYYEKPYSDLIGRVIGSGVHCGIYKITNLQNGMCYVGQSTNIAERWKQHIKRGLGADTPTRNKLYPIMATVGVENFSFEIIEECTKTQLNEREDFWQEYFKAKEFGYSIK